MAMTSPCSGGSIVLGSGNLAPMKDESDIDGNPQNLISAFFVDAKE
ncbi:hypothetical protein OAM01_01855 [bacterium]|nr:hypothetical protein [bacterium]